MARGTVKWFNPTKGYGFIQPQGGGGKDVFVHVSAVTHSAFHSPQGGDARNADKPKEREILPDQFRRRHALD